jgi:hypothetical protein
MAKTKDVETTLIVKLNSGDQIKMIFTDPAMAVLQLEQLRGQGIYMGQWIKEINIQS